MKKFQRSHRFTNRKDSRVHITMMYWRLRGKRHRKITSVGLLAFGSWAIRKKIDPPLLQMTDFKNKTDVVASEDNGSFIYKIPHGIFTHTTPQHPHVARYKDGVTVSDNGQFRFITDSLGF